MIGHWADTPVASTTALIKKYQLGGVIVMSAPENPQTIADWVTQWNAVSETPLFIAIDQEGGPVTRLKSTQFTQTGQRDITTAEQAYEIGRARGKELGNLGINMNFAPVLDTAVNPKSFMHSRTFPENTPTAILATSMITGMSEQNVIAVIKHFPGHDDTSVDSHNELPVVNISRSELPAFSKLFAEVISEKPTVALMTAHVQFPQIDTLPATLSSFFLTTYLREELAFTGLIITDDMSMDAIDTYYSTSEASQLALEAGANIILLAAEPADIEIIFPYLVTAIDTSPLLDRQITDSYLKVTLLK
jgi:beta-N-acetylhexosaminidase